MSKKVLATISLVINAGSAKASPPVGPALGSHGLNIMAFCKDFNARTADIKQNVPIPVESRRLQIKVTNGIMLLHLLVISCYKL